MEETEAFKPLLTSLGELHITTTTTTTYYYSARECFHGKSAVIVNSK